MGVILIIILLSVALFLGAIASILNKKDPYSDYLIWLILVLFMPILGSVVYFIIGRSRLVNYQIRHSKTPCFKY